jgi:5-methylcytosine-specific restriction endonuclease McrA
MANRWGIPNETEDIVKRRDLRCVYCGIAFTNSDESRKSKPTWEHIINDIRINGPDNIALCCFSCNASKGSKKLNDWLKSKYCFKNSITVETVAPIVKTHLDKSK